MQQQHTILTGPPVGMVESMYGNDPQPSLVSSHGPKLGIKLRFHLARCDITQVQHGRRTDQMFVVALVGYVPYLTVKNDLPHGLTVSQDIGRSHM